VHHKFTETHADPHNAKRGLFFSHMGWLCMKKHAEVKRQGAKLPLDDLLADPVVYYQKK
jgi:stearoyl-CoA desaturase (delta-9 desaturase)